MTDDLIKRAYAAAKSLTDDNFHAEAEVMTDLIEELRDIVSSDHSRGCEGRQYGCSCGYDHRTESALAEAADALAAKEVALSEMRAELETARVQFENTAQVRDTLYRDLDRVKTGLERARKALEPFAEQSRLFDEAAIHFSVSPMPDDHLCAIRVAHGQLRACALASQDEGEAR